MRTLGAPVTLERPRKISCFPKCWNWVISTRISKWYPWDWYIYLHLRQNQPNVGKFKYTWMVRVCSAGVTIVQWLTMIAMELICMDFSETIMARGTIRCLRWGRQEALHDATWSRSWKNPEMKNLCRHHQSSYFTSLNNSTVNLGRFYNMFSITFGGEVTGHYKIHPKMILFMVQKSQTTTVWMVLKPVVNNGINLPFPQLVSQISEPSTVWNSSKDDICVCVYHKVLFLCVCVCFSHVTRLGPPTSHCGWWPKAPTPAPKKPSEKRTMKHETPQLYTVSKKQMAQFHRSNVQKSQMLIL